MADIKTNYVWSFDLIENAMTKDIKEDFVASVRTQKSMTIDDIASQIALERTEYRIDTIKKYPYANRRENPSIGVRGIRW